MTARSVCGVLVLAVLIVLLSGQPAAAQGGPSSPNGPTEKDLFQLQVEIVKWYPLITTGLLALIAVLLLLILIGLPGTTTGETLLKESVSLQQEMKTLLDRLANRP
jgi:hypothetical protein